METTDRRLFLKYLGLGLTGAAAVGSGALGPLAEAGDDAGRGFRFTPIAPSQVDDLLVPEGYRWTPIASWGDALPGTTRRFGFNNDYTAFLPMPERPGEGLLWVNHEYLSLPQAGEIGVYQQTFAEVVGDAMTVGAQMSDVGGSVLHLRAGAGGRWTILPGLTRRYDATSRMVADGPALHGAGDVGGTLANCSGCQTPWGTVLTCEENFQDVVPEAVDTRGEGTVGGRFGRNGAHFGWVVEVDPFDPTFVPVKHTAMGRFRHENVTLRLTPGRPVVAYMGDDRTDGHVYRFVSDAIYDPAVNGRARLLSSGRLFAAVFAADGSGHWRELSPRTPLAPNPGSLVPEIPTGASTLGHVYRDEGAIVTDAFRACNLIGATPCGRPEDLEVHPRDQSVYIAFTANGTAAGSLFGNVHGELWRLVEDGDGTGTRFTWMRWRAGGPETPRAGGAVFGAPDNLSFDGDAHLWIATDIASSRLNADERFATFRNNGLFQVPVSGDAAGRALQFASAPCEAELTGPSWTPDYTTLFLSVQHPGEAHGTRSSSGLAPRGSNWPARTLGTGPRPTVVAISRT